MAVNTTQNYVYAHINDPNRFHRNYGNYNDFKLALIKVSEHQQLFQKELNGGVQRTDLAPHFDGNNSIAIGYGTDLLVRDNRELNRYLGAAGLPPLSGNDETTLNNARDVRNYYINTNYTAAQKTAYLNDKIASLHLNVAISAPDQVKYQAIIEYYVSRLNLRLGDITDANEMLAYHLATRVENRLTTMPESKERAAIVSVLYQLPKILPMPTAMFTK